MTEERLKEIEEINESDINGWNSSEYIPELIAEVRRCHAERESLRELLRVCKDYFTTVQVAMLMRQLYKDEGVIQEFIKSIDATLGEE